MAIKVTDFMDMFTGILNPNDETASQIIDRLLPRLNYADLSKAILAYDRWSRDTNLTREQKEMLFYQFDPVSALFNEFDLNKYKSVHLLLRKKNKRTGKSWWTYISEYLQNTGKLLEALSRNDKGIAELLQTKEGLEYLHYLAKRDYDFFYRWTWFFPRYHNGCGGKIKYGKRKEGSVSVWAFYCAKCGEIFPEQVMQEDYTTEIYTHKKRKNDKNIKH